MTESAPAADVLSAILRVLERIEGRLDAQEQRLNLVNGSSKPGQSIRRTSSTSKVDPTESREVDTHVQYLRDAHVEYPPSPSPEALAAWHKSEKHEESYNDPGFNYNEPDYNCEFRELLEAYIGDCWKLPDDKRLPLHLGNRLINWTHAAWSSTITVPATRRATLVRDLERLQQFDRDLRARPGNDFLIIDYDNRNNCRLYRVGNKAVGADPKVSLDEPSHHQWSRLMYVTTSLCI